MGAWERPSSRVTSEEMGLKSREEMGSFLTAGDSTRHRGHLVT